MWRLFLKPVVGVVALLAVVVWYSWKYDFGIAQIFKNQSGALFEKVSSVSDIYDRSISLWTASGEAEDLKRENLKLLERLSDQEAMIRENNRLREFLGLELEVDRVIEAGMFSASFHPDGYDLMINKGLDDGINEGDIVVSGQGFLIGRISRMDRDVSQITTILDPESKITIRVVGKEISGIAHGALGEGLFVDFISQDDDIGEGDLIVTNGSDQYPPGLTLGKVSSVKIEAGNLFKEVKVRPFLKEIRSDFVFIIK
jgi:rod shape-determining protein MreC